MKELPCSQEVSGDDNAATTPENCSLPSLNVDRTRTGLPGYMYSLRSVVIEMSVSAESTGKRKSTLFISHHIFVKLAHEERHTWTTKQSFSERHGGRID